MLAQFGSVARHHNPFRFIFVGVAICFVFIFLWSARRYPLVSHIGRTIVQQSTAQVECFEHAKTSLNVTQWGEMGERVNLLSQWASSMPSATAEELITFEGALLIHFPFLSGAQRHIYTPWSKTRTANSSSPSVGYVISAGSKNHRLAAHLITSLRQVHQVTEPIEIAYAGDADLKPEHRKFLQNLTYNISFINLLDSFPAARCDLIDSGWAMKPFALLASSHPRTILLDADAIFLESPVGIFDTNPGLARTGTLFFHDRAAFASNHEGRDFLKAQLEVAGRVPSQYLQKESLFYNGTAWYEADSGVVAMDKSRSDVFLGLVLATWMNTKEVRDQVSYKIYYGDKETFWIAMELSNVEYFFQPWYAGTIGKIEDGGTAQSSIDLAGEPHEICGTHMLHLDLTGRMPFWMNGGIYEHKDDPATGFAELTNYWVGETNDIVASQPGWYWHGNVGCLREKNVKVVPDSTKSNIEKIIAECGRIDQMP